MGRLLDQMIALTVSSLPDVVFSYAVSVLAPCMPHWRLTALYWAGQRVPEIYTADGGVTRTGEGLLGRSARRLRGGLLKEGHL